MTAAQPFEEVFDRVFPRAVMVARRIVGDLSAAEDAAAEAFARAYVRWRKLQHSSYVDAWIIRTTVNIALDQLRRQSRAGLRQQLPVDTDAQIDVAEAVRRLPRRQKEAVILRFYADLAEEDIAREMRIALGTVKATLHKAKATLRSELESINQEPKSRYEP